MSKLGSSLRQDRIIELLRIRPRNFKDLRKEIDASFQSLDLNLQMDIRTFQREKNEIYKRYKISISYNRAEKHYYIANEMDAAKERIFELQSIAGAINLSEGLSRFISFEKKQIDGTEHFFILLHAIKNSLTVEIKHNKYFEHEVVKVLNPLGLKEYRNRWYLIAEDTSKNYISTFGLDRICAIEVTNKKFKYLGNYNIEEAFKYAYGIMTIENKEPTEIVLSYTPYQGNYIKSLNLHHTQVTLIDNAKEFRIKLTIHLTYDFIMELLSHGDSVKVIKPKSLIKQLSTVYKNALRQY